jgi:hypothetical protein
VDATGLSRGDSRWQLRIGSQYFTRCHGLVPWSVTLSAFVIQTLRFSPDRVSLPRRKAVASAERSGRIL